MIDAHTRAALFAEIHRAIAETADSAVAAFGSAEPPVITYPPGETFSDEELAALGSLSALPGRGMRVPGGKIAWRNHRTEQDASTGVL